MSIDDWYGRNIINSVMNTKYLEVAGFSGLRQATALAVIIKKIEETNLRSKIATSSVTGRGKLLQLESLPRRAWSLRFRVERARRYREIRC